MNKLEILAMEAGRELDALVAYHIMKLDSDSPTDFALIEGAKPYSTDISAAWQVLEKMLEDGFSLELIVSPDSAMASFIDISVSIPVKSIRGRMVSELAPEAVCKAALLSKIINCDSEKII